MYHFLSFQFRRCAYHAKVMKVLEQMRRRDVRKRMADFTRQILLCSPLLANPAKHNSSVRERAWGQEQNGKLTTAEPCLVLVTAMEFAFPRIGKTA